MVYINICRWASAFAQFDIGYWQGGRVGGILIGKGDGVITKEEFSHAMGWESYRKGISKCLFACRGQRDEIFTLDSGVDVDLNKKVTWHEFLRAVEAKRMTEKGVMVEVR